MPRPAQLARAAARAAFFFALASCSFGGADDEAVSVDATADFSGAAIYAVDFSNADTVNLTVSGLAGRTLVLAKINTGSSAVSSTAVGAAEIAAASARSADSSSLGTEDAAASASGRPPRINHPLAGAYNASVAETRAAAARSAAASVRTASVSYGGSSAEYIEGNTTCVFWVDYYDDNGDLAFGRLSATLRKITDHAYFWVAAAGETDDGSISGGFDPSDDTTFSAKLGLLSDAFEEVVFPEDTALFGYERGGGTGGDGGIDGDQHISILLYDIDFDENDDDSGYVAGYFWSKDDDEADTENVYESAGAYPSNGKEMFYLDAKALSDYPYSIVSTLAHEYQHMINYNMVAYEGRTGATTWLDEFRSLAAEDLLAPAFAEYSADYDYWNDGPGGWAYYFSKYYPYAAGLDKWGYTVYDYAFASVFASYLLRAYGGAAFLADEVAYADSGYSSESSFLKAIDAAASRSGATDGSAPAEGAASGLSGFFSEILEPFVYALWGFGADGSADGTPFTRADALAASATASGSRFLDAYAIGSGSDSIYPSRYPLSRSVSIPTRSFAFFSDVSLRNVSGDLELTLTAPTDEDVEYRLIAIE